MSRIKLGFTLVVAAIAAAPLAPSARADQIFTDQASFLAATQPGSYLETFDGLSEGFDAGPLTFSNGDFEYEASAVGGFFQLTAPSDSTDILLSTNSALTDIVFTMTTPDVTAIGGFFFVTDLGGAVTNGSVTATLANGLQLMVSNPTITNFIGFTTTSAIVSLTVSVDTDFVTVNDLIVGRAVPEPSSLALGLSGLTLGGLAVRSRRRRADSATS